MDGVAVSLTTRHTLGMVRMDVAADDIRKRLRSLEPDLIVFELDNPETQKILTLIKDRPDMLLIGLDIDCSQAIILNSRQRPTRSMNDLRRVVLDAIGLKALAPQDGHLTHNDAGALEDRL
jgi:NAD(P)H-hydrate repair Nnr-like enzyme with NAD(P)H-hydrate dehydratase domain